MTFENPFNDEAYLYREISETANSVLPWLIFARRLYYGGWLLSEYSEKGHIVKDVRNVARMLLGMSIECYLKAYYVKNGNKIHVDEELKLTKHSLDKLVDDVTFCVSSEEKMILSYLSMFITVKGRYPIPKNLKQMKSPEFDNSAFTEKYVLNWKDEYDEVCCGIVKRLEESLSSRSTS